MGERTTEGQGKSKCFVFVTGKVPAMGLPQLSFHGENKALIFNSQCYACISWIFFKDIGEGLTICRCILWKMRDFYVPLYSLFAHISQVLHGTWDTGWLWHSKEEVSRGRLTQSLNGEVVSATSAAAHQQEIKCLRHSLSRVMKNSLFPSVKENHHKVVCLSLLFLFNKTILPQFLCRKILGDPLEVSQCNWFNTGGRS